MGEEVPKPEAPPVVMEAATEALPKAGTKRTERRIDREKDKADMDRQVMRTGIDEMDRNIQALQGKIGKEKDTGKAAKLRDQLTKDVAKRDAAYAEYKVMTSALDAKIAEVKKDLAEIQTLKKAIAELQTFIEANKADLSKSAEVAAKTHSLDEKQKELKKLTPEGREEDLLALLKVYEAEQTNIRGDAEHRDEIGEADRILDAVIGDLDAAGEAPDEEPEDKEKGKGKAKSTSSEGEEEKAARKKELLHNALHKVAYGLAVDLEKNYPGADGNAYEKMEWNGKAFLLKIVVMFGGTPKWAELVQDNPTLSTFLEKKVGMTFVQEVVGKDGVATDEKRWVVKWDKPVEGWEPGIVEMEDVFETVYGKEGMAKAMEGITAETTLAELETAAATDTENGGKPRKLVTAMKGAGANGETNVQEFLTKNAKGVQKKFLELTEEVTVGGGRDLGELLKYFDKTPLPSPEAAREQVVRMNLLPALSEANSTLSLSADTPLTDAFMVVSKPGDLSQEKEAEWAAGLVLFRGMASGGSAAIPLRGEVPKVDVDPELSRSISFLAARLVTIDAISAEEALSILRDVADGHLDASSGRSLDKGMNKMISSFAQALNEKTLGQALDEFKPKDDTEKAKVEAAKLRISLFMTETTFELKTDEESAKALAEQGIKFTEKSMVDVDDGNTLRDFGDAKTVEIKSLGSNMFTITATTPSTPSTTTGEMPSGVKTDRVTFTGMDKVPSNLKEPEAAT